MAFLGFENKPVQRFCLNCRKQTRFVYDLSCYAFGGDPYCQMCKQTTRYHCEQCNIHLCGDCCRKPEQERKRRLENEKRETFEKNVEQRLTALESSQTSGETEQSTTMSTQLNAMKAAIQRLTQQLALERRGNEEKIRTLTNRLDAMESDSKQAQTQESSSTSMDFKNKKMPYIVMHWFITDYCQMPRYVSNFEGCDLGAMDSRIIFDIDAQLLKSEFKIQQWHIRTFQRCIANVKTDWIELKSFLSQCKTVDLSRFALMAENKGVLGWEALSFVATDEQRLADIFEVKPKCKAIRFLWNAIVKFKETGQRPIADSNDIAAVSSVIEAEGNATDTKSLHF